MIILRGLTITIDAIEILDREADPNGVDAGRTSAESDPAGEQVPVNPGPPLGRVPPHVVPRQGQQFGTYFEKPGDTETPGAASTGTASCHAPSPGSPPSTLETLIAASKVRVESTSDAEREEHFAEQRASWVRGEIGMGSDADEAAYRANILTDDATVSTLMTRIGRQVTAAIDNPPAPVERPVELPLRRVEEDTLEIPAFLDRRRSGGGA